MTALKRNANLEAARRTAAAVPALAVAPPPATDVIAPEKRNVVFHLTPYAPGCEHVHAGDKARTLVFYNRRPGQALDTLCKRLEIGPAAIELTAITAVETSIHPVGRPDMPWAFIWAGLTFVETRRALDALIALRGAR